MTNGRVVTLINSRQTGWTEKKPQRSDTGKVSDLIEVARKLLRVLSPGYVSGMAYLG